MLCFSVQQQVTRIKVLITFVTPFDVKCRPDWPSRKTRPWKEKMAKINLKLLNPREKDLINNFSWY
jgi:hypothetical protein